MLCTLHAQLPHLSSEPSKKGFNTKQVARKIHTANEAGRQRELDQEHVTLYTIRSLEKGYLDHFKLDELPVPLGDCSFCSKYAYYSTIREAYAHLKKYHVDPIKVSHTFKPAQLSHWIASDIGAVIERKNEQMMGLVGAINTHLSKLRSKATDIRNSVADKNNEKPSDYLLPMPMVKAFENILQTIYTARFGVEALHEYHQTPDVMGFITSEYETNVSLVLRFAKLADTSLSKARDELLLMAHSGDTHDSVRHIRSTPETSVLMVLYFLSSQPLLGGLETTELYRDHLSSMVRNCPTTPQLTLLMQIAALRSRPPPLQTYPPQSLPPRGRNRNRGLGLHPTTRRSRSIR
jgi:hypothetical protein